MAISVSSAATYIESSCFEGERIIWEEVCVCVCKMQCACFAVGDEEIMAANGPSLYEAEGERRC